MDADRVVCELVVHSTWILTLLCLQMVLDAGRIVSRHHYSFHRIRLTCAGIPSAGRTRRTFHVAYEERRNVQVTRRCQW